VSSRQRGCAFRVLGSGFSVWESDGHLDSEAAHLGFWVQGLGFGNLTAISTARLRVAVSAAHSEEDVAALADALRDMPIYCDSMERMRQASGASRKSQS
jgi:hypothetical protein